MRTLIVLSSALILAGCATDPVVTGISDSSVRVLQRTGTSMTTVNATAQKACALYGKRAQYLSFACRGYCFQRYHLYACLK